MGILWLCRSIYAPLHSYEFLLVIASCGSSSMMSVVAANFPFKTKNDLYCGDICKSNLFNSLFLLFLN